MFKPNFILKNWSSQSFITWALSKIHKITEWTFLPANIFYQETSSTLTTEALSSVLRKLRHKRPKEFYSMKTASLGCISLERTSVGYLPFSKNLSMGWLFLRKGISGLTTSWQMESLRDPFLEMDIHGMSKSRGDSARHNFHQSISVKTWW